MKNFRKLLFPLGWLYGTVLALRKLSFRWGMQKVARLPLPIISVGNISTGGTGKTPMAEFLLGKLVEMGYRPAYLSRGYGRKSKGFLWVDPQATHGDIFGDEAFQVAHKFPDLPVAVCENRVEGVQRMLQERPDAVQVVVLDDAFQHLRIHRDLDLLMIDCNRPPWRDLVLPAGNLREFRIGLRRADLLIFSKFSDPAQARQLQQRHVPHRDTAAFTLEPQAPVPFFPANPAHPSASFPTKPAPKEPRTVFAFSGLGNNDFFFTQVRAQYPQLTQTFAFPDHHVYRPSDLAKILEQVQSHPENSTNLAGALLLTTEKDFFRLRGQTWPEGFQDLSVCYLPVQMSACFGEEVLDAHLQRILNSIPAHGG